MEISIDRQHRNRIRVVLAGTPSEVWLVLQRVLDEEDVGDVGGSASPQEAVAA